MNICLVSCGGPPSLAMRGYEHPPRQAVRCSQRCIFAIIKHQPLSHCHAVSLFFPLLPLPHQPLQPPLLFLDSFPLRPHRLLLPHFHYNLEFVQAFARLISRAERAQVDVDTAVAAVRVVHGVVCVGAGGWGKRGCWGFFGRGGVGWGGWGYGR